MTRPLFDLSLYLVLDPAFVGPRGIADTLRGALEGGVSMVQLRDKQLSRPEFLELARRLQGLLEGSGVPLVINDRVDVAAEIGARGVHVGQSDMPVSEVRRRLGPGPIVGLSVSRASELGDVDPLLVDYLGVGPIFPTNTKLDTPPALGAESMPRFKARLGLPVVAIGGINVGNAAQVIAAGADGVAVVSAICAASDPKSAAEALALEIERGRSQRPKREGAES
jgi:thiamine-phosphate pyrophosphorylase